MINSGLLICSFFLKKRFSKGTNNIVELNNCIKDEYGNEYKDVWSLFNIFLNSSNDTTDDEKNMKLFSVDKTTIKNHSCQIYTALFTLRKMLKECMRLIMNWVGMMLLPNWWRRFWNCRQRKKQLTIND